MKEADDRPKLFFGGERFIAQQREDGGWTVLDGRYREKVGLAEKSHEAAEQRAAALNAADARLRLEGRELGREERDKLDAVSRGRIDQRSYWEAVCDAVLGHHALQNLPPRQRAVVVLRDVLGYHTAEVAEILDSS